MLSHLFPPAQLSALLLPPGQWHPFPTAAERAPWEALPPALRQAYVERPAGSVGEAWPSLPATLFLDFARTGNRSRYEQVWFRRRGRLCDLVLAECVEGQGRFVDAVADGVWATCEETYWGLPAHIGMQRAGVGLPDAAEPTVDLFAGETVALLAWTLYLLGDRLDAVSPLIRARMHQEADRRVLTPCLERDDFWWMGFDGRPVNNWNPWVNSSWLTAALLLEPEPERRLRAVAKAMASLDRFIGPYPDDGGCDEGPSYWGRAAASLLDCLELLYGATEGRIDAFAQPLIAEMGRFIYRAQIADRYYVNFADAPALVSPSATLVYRYGQRIGDAGMQALGAHLAREQDLARRGLADSIGRQLPGLFLLEQVLQAQPAQPLPRDVWLPRIQVMVARDEASTAQGLYVAAKGGHNAESHNHNDVGHFIVYRDGRPVIVDAGVEAYTAKTFSAQRYEIWTMQSAYHSLPTIGGVMQASGPGHAARHVRHEAMSEGAWLELDLAGAYPPEAGLSRWLRRIELRRGAHVEVTDEYALERPVPDIRLSLLTPCPVEAAGPGVLVLPERELAADRRTGSLRLYYPADVLRSEVEEVPVEDPGMGRVWGGRLWRIQLCVAAPASQGRWTLRLAP